MHIEGSCHCRRVRFSCDAYAPVPYQRCYCSICRKQQGGGGYTINLSARSDTLTISGEEHLGCYRARIDDDEHEGCELSSGERRFCRECGSALWLFDPGWPELVHPFASAIDSPLPASPSQVHMMLKYKADWVQPTVGDGDRCFDLYPEQSIEEWHKDRRLWVP